MSSSRRVCGEAPRGSTKGLFLAGLAAAALPCACGPDRPSAPGVSGASWTAADALFHADPRWLGSDGAYSVDLGGDRSLWLFGDTFVATSEANVRSESRLVRNTVGLQTGRDPLTAGMALFWRTDAEGGPASYFAEEGEEWRWPGHGVRLGDDGPLVLFLSALRAEQGDGLGFASAGWRAVVVDDPDLDPGEWAPRPVAVPETPFDAVAGCAAVREAGFVVALATRASGDHAGYLVRLREDALVAGAATPEWWAGDDGWVSQDALDGEPTVVLDEAGAECSLHFDAAMGLWVHVASRGFGATTIAVRVAERLEGPYSDVVDAFMPPESEGPDPFVYAAKAHPQLAVGDGELAVTYATNSFDFWDLFTPEGQALYWPRFVRLAITRPSP